VRDGLRRSACHSLLVPGLCHVGSLMTVLYAGDKGMHRTSATAGIWPSSLHAEPGALLRRRLLLGLGRLTDVPGDMTASSLPSSCPAARAALLDPRLSLPAERAGGSRSWGDTVLGDSASRMLLILLAGRRPGELAGLPRGVAAAWNSSCSSAAASSLCCAWSGGDRSTGFACPSMLHTDAAAVVSQRRVPELSKLLYFVAGLYSGSGLHMEPCTRLMCFLTERHGVLSKP
jgi:hypothetical protein